MDFLIICFSCEKFTLVKICYKKPNAQKVKERRKKMVNSLNLNPLEAAMFSCLLPKFH